MVPTASLKNMLPGNKYRKALNAFCNYFMSVCSSCWRYLGHISHLLPAVLHHVHLPLPPLTVQLLPFIPSIFLFHSIFLSHWDVLLPAVPHYSTLFFFVPRFHPLVFLHYRRLRSLVRFSSCQREGTKGSQASRDPVCCVLWKTFSLGKQLRTLQRWKKTFGVV